MNKGKNKNYTQVFNSEQVKKLEKVFENLINKYDL